MVIGRAILAILIVVVGAGAVSFGFNNQVTPGDGADQIFRGNTFPSTSPGEGVTVDPRPRHFVDITFVLATGSSCLSPSDLVLFQVGGVTSATDIGAGILIGSNMTWIGVPSPGIGNMNVAFEIDGGNGMVSGMQRHQIPTNNTLIDMGSLALC